MGLEKKLSTSLIILLLLVVILAVAASVRDHRAEVSASAAVGVAPRAPVR